MSDIKPLAILSKTGDRVSKINTQLRLLWTRYDPDLNTKVDTIPLIRKYIMHAYKDAGFINDFATLEKE
jgi:hypothetical protein